MDRIDYRVAIVTGSALPAQGSALGAPDRHARAGPTTSSHSLRSL